MGGLDKALSIQLKKTYYRCKVYGKTIDAGRLNTFKFGTFSLATY